jgi:hypothetical protein
MRRCRRHNGQPDARSSVQFSGQNGNKAIVFIFRVTGLPSRGTNNGATITQAAFGSLIADLSVIWSKSMTSSIKAIIRAWWVPEHRVNCRFSLWKQIVIELARRGGHTHEAGVFLLGVEKNGRREVTETVFYDDLDPNVYATGVCVLHGEAFAKLWALCREKKLTVVADIHAHPGAAFQSHSDKTNPMVAKAGHIAIIIPDFARWPVPAERLGIFEYRGQHQWIDHSPPRSGTFLYTGFWS